MDPVSLLLAAVLVILACAAFAAEVPGQVFTGNSFTPHHDWLLSMDDRFQQKSVQIDTTARDSTNTPTTLLRSGLVMGKVTASGRYKEYDNADADGTEVARGILLHPVNLLDPLTGSVLSSHPFGAIVISGYVRAANLYGYDAAAKTDLDGEFLFAADFET